MASCVSGNNGSGGGPRNYKLVFVVDDLDLMRRRVEARVHSLGVAYRPFSDGATAIAALDGDRPDAVVTDWNMPDIGGGEVCLAASRRGIPCIVISADDLGQEVLKQHGAGWFVPKRRLDDLPAVLRDVLASVQGRRR